MKKKVVSQVEQTIFADPNTIARLCQFILDGGSIGQFAVDVCGVTFRSFNEWLRSNADRQLAYENAFFTARDARISKKVADREKRIREYHAQRDVMREAERVKEAARVAEEGAARERWLTAELERQRMAREAAKASQSPVSDVEYLRRMNDIRFGVVPVIKH